MPAVGRGISGKRALSRASYTAIKPTPVACPVWSLDGPLTLEAPHHLHFAAVTVKAQAEGIFAHFELQRLGPEAGHLFRAEVLAVADAVLSVSGQPCNSSSTIHRLIGHISKLHTATEINRVVRHKRERFLRGLRILLNYEGKNS